MIESSKSYDINDLLNTLELSYKNNHLLDTLEKKYNKLINTEIIPHVNVILCQYYLVILGGDYQSNGLVNELKFYICKLKNNLSTLEKINMSSLDEKTQCRIKNIKDIIVDNETRSNKTYKNMIDTYHKYLQISIEDKECSRFNLNNLHKLQLISNYNCKHQIENQEHVDNLNKELVSLNNMLDSNNEEEIIVKFIDSQISVIEQQFDFFKV